MKDAWHTYLQLPALNANIVTYHDNVDYVKNGNICTYSPPTDNSDCCKSYVYPSG